MWHDRFSRGWTSAETIWAIRGVSAVSFGMQQAWCLVCEGEKFDLVAMGVGSEWFEGRGKRYEG